jgi:hypothetical protein
VLAGTLLGASIAMALVPASESEMRDRIRAKARSNSLPPEAESGFLQPKT